MKPWHYIIYDDKLGLVTEAVAEAALLAIKADKTRTVQDNSCNLSPTRFRLRFIFERNI